MLVDKADNVIMIQTRLVENDVLQDLQATLANMSDYNADL